MFVDVLNTTLWIKLGLTQAISVNDEGHVICVSIFRRLFSGSRRMGRYREHRMCTCPSKLRCYLQIYKQ